MGRRIENPEAYSPLKEKLLTAALAPINAAPPRTEGGAALSVVPPQSGVTENPSNNAEPPAPVGLLFKRRQGKKDVTLTPQEEQDLARILSELSVNLGTKVAFGHVARAWLQLMIHAEHELRRETASLPKRLVRPANGAAAQVHLFEKEIATIIQRAVSSAKEI